MESRRVRRLKSRQNRKSATRRLFKLLASARSGIACLAVAVTLLTSSLAYTPPRNAEALTVPQGQTVLSAAYSYWGTPYVFNAYWRGLYGMDCSELTMYAYRTVGISLPDDPVALQYGYGRWVSTPRAGDILFFSEDYSGRATHVGIATGRGTVVHASSYYGSVTETELRWMPGYMGAKRI